jgi:hypothetical protein
LSRSGYRILYPEYLGSVQQELAFGFGIIMVLPI